MKLSEFIKKYGNCEITEEIGKCIYRKSNKWMPERGNWYYYINDEGFVDCDLWDGFYIDNYRRVFMRIFKTGAEAERYLEIIRACKEASFEPDWENDKQYKYFFEWIDSDQELDISFSFVCNNGCQFYFESKEIMKELINKFG